MSDALNDALNRGILHERAFTFASNVQRNRPLIEKWGGLRSFPPQIAGKHVVITGAAPSLEKTIPLCREASQSSSHVIIASDMSLKVLLGNGIKPRYAISCETTPRGFFSGCPTEDITLLAFSCSSPSNLRQWHGSYLFYNWLMRGDFWDDLWRKAGEELGYVATGGTVVTQALALVLGCSAASLTFAGNDLAFTRQCYARGTVHDELRCGANSRFSPRESIEFSIARNASHYRIERGGRSFFTSAQFLAAKQWCEKLCEGSQIPVFDASHPGLSGKFVTKIC